MRCADSTCVAEQHKQDWECSQQTCLIRTDIIEHVNTGQVGWDFTALLPQFSTAQLTLKANSHRHARHDKTVLSVSCPLRRRELDFRQLKTVADGKFEVWTRSQQSSNSHRHTRYNTDKTVLSCLVWRYELSPPDHPTSTFYLGVCRAAQALPVRPPDALRCRTHLSGDRADSVHTAWHDTDKTVLSCLAGGVNLT